MTSDVSAAPVSLSIGLLARNEADSIGAALQSLFRQTLWAELAACGRRAEIVCVVNGSTDGTADTAAQILGDQSFRHPHRQAFTTRVHTLREAGRINAWNFYVHGLSAPEADKLILMDADIMLGQPTTLWNLCRALEDEPAARVAVDAPVKDLVLKINPSLRERLSLATSHMTRTAPAQMTGQLYCIRSAVVRRIRLPRDLTACEDGFIKSLVCTDFGAHASRSEHIVRAPDASHVFAAYTRPGEIMRNQKRQMMGQAFVHVLVDQFLPQLTPSERADLAGVVHRLDEHDPGWLRELMTAHLRRTRRFWRLFPGVLTFRFRRLALLPAGERLRHLPAALAGFFVTLAACWLAARALRRGETKYWPDKHHRRPADDRRRPPLGAAQPG